MTPPPGLTVVDLHSHVIADDVTRFPLAPMGGKQSEWSKERPVTGDGMLAAMEEAGVAQSVLVQASTCYGHDNSYVQACVAADPARFAGVFSVDMQAGDAIANIQKWLRAGLAGARVFIAGHTAADRSVRLDDPRGFAAWQYIADQHIPICVQLRADGLPQLEALLKRFPEAIVLLDHFARPELDEGPPYSKAAGLLALSRFKNLHFKYTTHNVRESKAGKATQASFIRTMVDAFGAQRIGWGSNFPASSGTLRSQLAEAMEATATLSSSEREWIFSYTARRLYPVLAQAQGSAAAEARGSVSRPALKLKTLLGDYPNTRALKSGALAPKGFEFEFADVKVPNRAFKRVVRNLEFAVAELALVTYFQAKAYGKPLALLPAVVGAGRYQHHCLVYNAERARITVAQLQGKRIGIRAHAQTTIAWVRGILADDYGVTLNEIRWVTFEDGHLAEFPDPPGFIRAPEGSSMVEMLLAGELDAAIIGTDLPDDPRLKPVLPDPHTAAPAWGARHRMVPINHMVAVDTALCRERPEVLRELYTLLEQSKQMAAAGKTGGPNLTPFGVEPNRRALELLLQYSFHQGLIPRVYAVDELFEDFNRLW